MTCVCTGLLCFRCHQILCFMQRLTPFWGVCLNSRTRCAPATISDLHPCQLVLGGFGAAGCPSLSHHPGIRTIRRKIYAVMLAKFMDGFPNSPPSQPPATPFPLTRRQTRPCFSQFFWWTRSPSQSGACPHLFLTELFVYLPKSYTYANKQKCGKFCFSV